MSLVTFKSLCCETRYPKGREGDGAAPPLKPASPRKSGEDYFSKQLWYFYFNYLPIPSYSPTQTNAKFPKQRFFTHQDRYSLQAGRTRTAPTIPCNNLQYNVCAINPGQKTRKISFYRAAGRIVCVSRLMGVSGNLSLRMEGFSRWRPPRSVARENGRQ
ncbi:hypothetical protein CEXT_419881 [Caerostris extrusa]|uniref:Uncharacterized protein n=1 Tax=Caerostris extrusa TaxID=172846 RepID=A0AAV4SH89_CAEEX|nr:hypothetical protein CEXT_419881 [Caerostris extrusa]